LNVAAASAKAAKRLVRHSASCTNSGRKATSPAFVTSSRQITSRRHFGRSSISTRPLVLSDSLNALVLRTPDGELVVEIERAGRPAAIAEALRSERLDQEVEPGGYAWWYVDAISDDRRHGLTIIAFVGSVFSPYCAWSGRADPLNHCAVAIALYGTKASRSTASRSPSPA